MKISPIYSLWLTARPKTLSAAVIPVMVATALVHFEGHSVSPWISVFAVFSAIFIQVGTNFVNDALDFKKGADTETRLGEARAAQSGWFSPNKVLAMGIAFFGLALVLGIPLVLLGGWPILVVGLLSLLMGYGYTGGPFPLAYLGLGDLFVILFFGLVAVGGVYFLQTLSLNWAALVAGLQVGMLATVLIAINNLRDLDQDQLVGKKTFAVRVGPIWGRREVLFLLVLSFALNFFWLFKGATFAAVLPLLAIPHAYRLVSTLLNTQAGREYNRLLALGAFVHMLFGVMLSVGFLIR
jgi:1,4-dihydroxy-2-naphthoate octaprenyltransferase